MVLLDLRVSCRVVIYREEDVVLVYVEVARGVAKGAAMAHLLISLFVLETNEEDSRRHKREEVQGNFFH